jgi:hypothetical protein
LNISSTKRASERTILLSAAAGDAESTGCQRGSLVLQANDSISGHIVFPKGKSKQASKKMAHSHFALLRPYGLGNATE